LAIICWLFWGASVSAQNQPSVSEINPEIAAMLTNAPPSGFTTRMEYIRSFTRESAILDAYHAGKLNKDEAMLALAELGDKVSNDTYGKVVDQSGNPLAEVKVVGNVDLAFGDSKAYKTTTDAQGLFHFLGLRGQGLGVELEKNGYYFDYMSPSADRPNSYLPDPNNPLIFTMWKMRGAEPMVHDKKFYGINPDGRVFTIDLLNKQKIEGTNAVGDLWVQIQRPAKIKRGEKFDWSLVITAIGGGVIEVTNTGYLYEAPESGYQQTYEVHMTAADPSWQEQISRTFYIKSRDGKVYGHFHVNIIPNYNDTSVFDMESYVNPAGSRNLEFDPSKQIIR
jgi:hypothetical protein